MPAPFPGLGLHFKTPKIIQGESGLKGFCGIRKILPDRLHLTGDLLCPGEAPSLGYWSHDITEGLCKLRYRLEEFFEFCRTLAHFNPLQQSDERPGAVSKIHRCLSIRRKVVILKRQEDGLDTLPDFHRPMARTPHGREKIFPEARIVRP